MPKADLNGVGLYYELSGNLAGPVLVLVNSLGSNLHMWDRVLRPLEKDHRVLRYDVRGHGMSAVPPPPYTLDQLGQDLIGLLDRLKMGRVRLCGLSLGGVVGMWMGIHVPERVERLILANTGARIGDGEMWDARVALVRSRGMAALAEMTLGRWFTETYRLQHPAEMERVRTMVADTPPDGYLGCCAVLRESDLRSELGRISVPCLIITGTHDPATPPAYGLYLRDALANSSYVELEASHLSAWESPEEFADAVLAFLTGKGGSADG